MPRLRRMRRTLLTATSKKATRLSVVVAMMTLSALHSRIGYAQLGKLSAVPAHVHQMDGQSPVLKPLLTGSGFVLDRQMLDTLNSRFGRSAERMQLRGPAGRMAHFAYPIPPAPVIREFEVRADVLSNRPGVMLAVQVILPRAINPKTGRAFELLVRAANPGHGASWETIALDNLPELLADHARVARAQHGETLDEREAYVSQIVFLVPGGSGVTDLIVDRVQVFGVLNRQQTPIHQTSATTSLPATEYLDRRQEKTNPVPRVFQWQGEPFQSLQQLGFNAIGMNRLPTTDQLQQAEQLGLSIVCPPPLVKQLNSQGIGAEYGPVIAWDLGEQFSPGDFSHVAAWEQLVSRTDPVSTRPTVLAPQIYALEASRISDIVMTGRAVLGSDLSVREHVAWLNQQQRLTRPGTPIWIRVESQLNPSQQLQVAALSQNAAAPTDATYAQLTALTSAAMSVEAGGFYFASHEGLGSVDTTISRRSTSLHLTNLRLQLAEAWIATGNKISTARSSQSQLSALVLQAERSHLLVPMWWSARLRSPTTMREAGPVSFIVPDVSESSDAYLVTLSGLQRVRHQRVTGGVRVTVPHLPFDSFVLFTDDPQAIAQVSRYLRRIALQATKMRRDLANSRLSTTAQSLARFPAAMELTQQLELAKNELAACDRSLAANSFQSAYLEADRVELILDQLEQHLLLQESEGYDSIAVQDGPLPLAERALLRKSLTRLPVTTNLLASGGFEDLQALLNSGWRHQQLELDGVTSAVRLSPKSPHSGSYCLELEARSLSETESSVVVPTAPVWISSVPVRVQSGDLVEITGVARIVDPLLGSVDGLQVFDSLGGPDLALRIHEAPIWQPFRILRAATSDADVNVTIALSGLGKAQVDDVALRVIKRK